MESNVTIFPKAGDLPRGEMSPSQKWGDIPVLRLTEDGYWPALQFNSTDYDAAVSYLSELVQQAVSLLEAIQQGQRQAALLAEVQATEHDPEAAAQIRASYALETSGSWDEAAQ